MKEIDRFIIKPMAHFFFNYIATLLLFPKNIPCNSIWCSVAFDWCADCISKSGVEENR